MAFHRTIITLLLVASLLLLMQAPKPARASGEVFTLSATPSWTTEGNAAGVGLVLSVSNAMFNPPTTYTFNWTVIDPSGKSTAITNSTVSTVAAWSERSTYPTSFGASINLVGKYNVNVAEVFPASNPSIARGQFQIGLTGSPKYNRNSLVTVTASGYLPSDTVRMTLTRGANPVPGFPITTSATPTGLVTFYWQTFPNTPLGTYNVSLSGTNTPSKNPPDQQAFPLLPTNTTINGIWASSSTLVRTQSLVFKFNATYLNGVPATTGSAQLNLTEPGGLASHLILAAYDTTQQSFVTSYSTILASTTGTWTVSLMTGAYDDGYGNGGPLSPVTSIFTVQNAVLTIQAQQYSTTFSAGSTIAISSRVVTPAGANFTQGSVSATINNSAGTVGPINLVYDQTQGRWTGSYKVGSSDPSGTWVLSVNARDAYGNNGQTSTSLNVNTPGPQGSGSPFTVTWIWLVPILTIAGTGFVMLIFRLRKGIHREVKLDLNAIHSKAEEVKSGDFLQSIKAQLKRRTDKTAQEKEKPKSD